jgi:hypothetical protein
MSVLVHDSFASLPVDVAHQFTLASNSHDVKGTATSMLWEALQRLLFVTVKSLEGFITNVIHSPLLRNGTSFVYVFNEEIRRRWRQ